LFAFVVAVFAFALLLGARLLAVASELEPTGLAVGRVDRQRAGVVGQARQGRLVDRLVVVAERERNALRLLIDGALDGLLLLRLEVVVGAPQRAILAHGNLDHPGGIFILFRSDREHA